MRVRRYGHGATIIDQLAHCAIASLRDAVLDACELAGLRCVDVVPTATSLVVTHPAHGTDEICRVLASLSDHETGVAQNTGPVIEIAVHYDGADLADVARACSLTVERVIALHNEAEYEVSFCGFAPGFAYLVGLPRELQLPRRTSPRTHVPAGSVAIAAMYSAVYPHESPGGWHLIGTTTATMWDVSRQPPALLQPRTRVRFVRVVR